MRVAIVICFTIFFLAIMAGFTGASRPGIGVEPAIGFFKTQSVSFATSASELQQAIVAIKEDDPHSIENARTALKNCRLNYKKIEFFLSYFFKSSALIYNAPPKYEIEEPYMEYQEPIGLQVIESLLFDKKAALKKEALLQQVDAVCSSARDLNALLFGFQADDRQLLESVRLQLLRVITLDITGFDAPFLKSGLDEAEASLDAMEIILHPFLQAGNREADSVSKYLSGSTRFIEEHKDFDSFDRLAFLTRHALPLQQHLGLLIKELQLECNTTGGVLNYNAKNIFSKDALTIPPYPAVNRSQDATMIALGKKLFFETALSGNNKISCATCHDPSKYFADGLDKSIGFDGHSPVQRNAATLLYTGFQYEQFWDGRAKSLEEQIKTVMANPQEMNGGQTTVASMLKQKPVYLSLLKNVFPADSIAATEKIAVSIAAFVRSLDPRNSRFDRYIEGEANTLIVSEIRGFNLFMGKAQCGTCHFAPLFNGLVPPLYNRSEVEVLGTTKTDDFTKPVRDTDQGRYNIFPIEFYSGAFKTPTVRNASATGPWMHNGSFKTLEAVVEFYNKGGGSGLGLKVNNQTLSAEPLHLTKTEVSDIVSFLGSLKDSLTVEHSIKQKQL